MTSVTITPVAPRIPADYPNQRYFNGTSGADVSARRDIGAPPVAVRVYRDGDEDYAELSVRVWPLGELRAWMNPDELRALAAAIISAAHDIEQNPAAVLMRAAAE